MLSNVSTNNQKDISKELLSMQGISCICWNKDFSRIIILFK